MPLAAEISHVDKSSQAIESAKTSNENDDDPLFSYLLLPGSLQHGKCRRRYCAVDPCSQKYEIVSLFTIESPTVPRFNRAALFYLFADVKDLIMAHIHYGNATTNGPPVVNLVPLNNEKAVNNTLGWRLSESTEKIRSLGVHGARRLRNKFIYIRLSCLCSELTLNANCNGLRAF